MDSAIFVQNINFYCKAKGTPPTVACRESGAGNSFIANIKKGQIPSVEKVQQLAAYLGCTVSDLLGEAPPGQKEGPATVSDDSKPDVLVKLETLSPSAQQEVMAFIQFKRTQEGLDS